MKNILPIQSKKWLHLMVSLGIAVLLVSCGNDSQNPSNSYSDNGARLSQNVIKLCQDINESLNNQAYQDQFIRILSSSSPETYQMKVDSAEKVVDLQYLYLMNALKSLEKVFIAYHLQLDIKITAQATELREKMMMACNSLDSLNLSDELKIRNQLIKKGIGAGKLKTENLLFQLTDLYDQMWNQISQKYLITIAQYKKDYENGIKRIPVEAFNAEKIKTLIDEPYSNNAVLVNLYKLKLVKDNYSQMSVIEARMRNTEEAFNLLVQIQGELIKRKKDVAKIQELNNALEVLISNN